MHELTHIGSNINKPPVVELRADHCCFRDISCVTYRSIFFPFFSILFNKNKLQYQIRVHSPVAQLRPC